MKKTTNLYETKTMRNTEQKAARTDSTLQRVMDSAARYMSNYAVIRGNLPSFNSSFMSL